MAANIGDLLQQVRNLAESAAAARAAAEQDRRRRRQENDRYVSGGVNWDGFSLESLQKMVGEQASPAQLDMLADEWEKHGGKVNQASQDLSRSLNTLMQYWSGASSQDASRQVVTNAAWISELGGTAQQMAAPIQDAGGALRSAQDTMPGKPSSSWFATAGGGAAAGFAVGGPLGAAFGAALGGIASAFGFGSNKKKLKRKAVQTMQRFETAVLGIDGTTPQFGGPATGVDPGANQGQNTPPQVNRPGPGTPRPPGSALPPLGSGGLPPSYNGVGMGTSPSFAPGISAGWEGRWQGLTGVGGGAGIPGGGYNTGGTGIGGLGGLGVGGLGGRGLPGGGWGGGRGGAGIGSGRPGAGLGRGGAGAGRGTGWAGRAAAAGRPGSGTAGVRGRGGLGAGGGAGGLGGRGGADSTKGRSRFGRGTVLGEESETARNRGRYGRGGALGEAHGRNGYGPAGGANAREEEDGEHIRRVPIEEDPFTADLKAAPPVIGL